MVAIFGLIFFGLSFPVFFNGWIKSQTRGAPDDADGKPIPCWEAANSCCRGGGAYANDLREDEHIEFFFRLLSCSWPASFFGGDDIFVVFCFAIPILNLDLVSALLLVFLANEPVGRLRPYCLNDGERVVNGIHGHSG